MNEKMYFCIFVLFIHTMSSTNILLRSFLSRIQFLKNYAQVIFYFLIPRAYIFKVRTYVLQKIFIQPVTGE